MTFLQVLLELPSFFADTLRWCVSPAFRRRSHLQRWGWRRALEDIRVQGHEAVIWRFVGEREKRVFAGLDDGEREFVFHDAYNLACLAYLSQPDLREEIWSEMQESRRKREEAVFADPAYGMAMARRHVGEINAFRDGTHPRIGEYAGTFAAMGCAGPVGRLELAHR